MSLLQVRDLAKCFGGVKAVDGVSFDLQAGQMPTMPLEPSVSESHWNTIDQLICAKARVSMAR